MRQRVPAPLACCICRGASPSSVVAHRGALHRVQEGAVDEVSFCAAELGPLAALIVGPEQGRWVCEEVDVSSSRTGHTDRRARRRGCARAVLCCAAALD